MSGAGAGTCRRSAAALDRGRMQRHAARPVGAGASGRMKHPQTAVPARLRACAAARRADRCRGERSAALAAGARGGRRRPLAHELLAAELRWLRRQQEHRRPGELAAALAQARRDLAAAAGARPRAGTADVVGAARPRRGAGGGRDRRRTRARAALCARRSCAVVRAVAHRAAIEQEVGERFAVLSTAIDDAGPAAPGAPAAPQTAAVVEALGRHHRLGDLPPASRAAPAAGRRRPRTGAPARGAPRRARGVTVLETTNFVLLLVVLATLLVEAT